MSTDRDQVGRSAEELNQEANRIQELLAQIDALPDARAGALVQDCVAGLLRLHGAGLARILHFVARYPDLHQELIDDEYVSGLLLIHGLHPADLTTRLKVALEKLLPYIRSHGGDLELVGIENNVAKLKFEGACKTCPSSAVTFELAIKRAVAEACPELLDLEIQGVEHPAVPPGAK